jgi:4-amino-4-deoxy-L-arabinose transferase-like glycosyltransferase
VLLGGQQLFVEHAVLSEPVFGFLNCAALWCAARTLDSSRLRWSLAAGALLGLAACVRLAIALVPLAIAGWLLLTGPERRLARLRAPAVLIAGLLIPLTAYQIAHHHSTGTWSITRAGNYNLYARAATFANCHKFTPPPGTARLCEDTPPARRPGPSFYAFGASPANLVYGGTAQFPPNDAAIRHVGAFARAAIRGQPLDYASTVAQNAWRFLSPGSFTAHSGESQAQLIDQLFAPANYQLTAGLVKSVYGTPALLQRHGVAHLRTYERHTRFNAVILLILAALVVTGAIVARERARVGVALFGLNAAALALTPALTLFYDARYAIPTYGPLVAAAAFGAWGAYERATKRDGAGAPAQPAGAGE